MKDMNGNEDIKNSHVFAKHKEMMVLLGNLSIREAVRALEFSLGRIIAESAKKPEDITNMAIDCISSVHKAAEIVYKHRKIKEEKEQTYDQSNLS